MLDRINYCILPDFDKRRKQKPISQNFMFCKLYTDLTESDLKSPAPFQLLTTGGSSMIGMLYQELSKRPANLVSQTEISNKYLDFGSGSLTELLFVGLG